MPDTFFCKHTFIFIMGNKSFLNVYWTTGNCCILYSQVVKKWWKMEQYYSGEKGALKNLAEQQKSLDS